MIKLVHYTSIDKNNAGEYIALMEDFESELEYKEDGFAINGVFRVGAADADSKPWLLPLGATLRE